MKKKLLFLSVFTVLASLANAQYIINTIAGNGVQGYTGDGVQATTTALNYTEGVARDATGNIYIGDWSNYRIRLVNTNGIISTIAGTGVSGYSGDGGQATAAQVSNTMGVCTDALGNVYIADEFNSRIRKINTSGVISTVVGTATAGFSGDGGQATAAEIDFPLDVVTDGANNIYITDYNSRIRMVNVATGVIKTVVGNGVFTYAGDGGPALSASIAQPWGIWVNGTGSTIYIADTYNQRLRKATVGGNIVLVAGNGTVGFGGDGGPATAAMLNYLTGVYLDGGGNAFVADIYNERVRKVTPAGIISSVAGNGVQSFSGDGGPATAAELNDLRQLVMDPAGNVYIGDLFNNRIRKLTNTVLPITLLSFDAEYQASSNTVPLTWTTASETNNKVFTIEKQADGDNWQTVATVAGAGNSTQSINYSAIDNNPIPGTSYYRLMQTDYDGHYTYSDIKAVNIPENYFVDIYPNPLRDNLSLKYNSITTNPVTISVVDITGAEVIRAYNLNNVQAGMNNISVNTAFLNKGMYFLVVNNGTHTYYKKFIKQ